MDILLSFLHLISKILSLRKFLPWAINMCSSCLLTIYSLSLNLHSVSWRSLVPKDSSARKITLFLTTLIYFSLPLALCTPFFEKIPLFFINMLLMKAQESVTYSLTYLLPAIWKRRVVDYTLTLQRTSNNDIIGFFLNKYFGHLQNSGCLSKRSTLLCLSSLLRIEILFWAAYITLWNI